VKTDNKKEDVKKVVEKKTRKVLQSLDYAYKKVEGISGKVTHLIRMDGRLIAAGVGGVFEVNGLEANELLGVPVRTIFYSPTLSQMLVSTYNDRVRTLALAKDGWEETHLLDTLRDYVGNIFEDHVQNIWLCGRAGVVKVEMIDGEVSSVSSVPFAEPVLDETMGFALGTEVFVAASGAFHQYDVVKHQFTRHRRRIDVCCTSKYGRTARAGSSGSNITSSGCLYAGSHHLLWQTTNQPSGVEYFQTSFHARCPLTLRYPHHYPIGGKIQRPRGLG